MLQHRETVIRFDPTSGQEQVEYGTVKFAGKVRTAAVSINGFDIGYSDGDHHLWRQKVDLNVAKVDNDVVRIQCRFLFRDSSGTIDDRFDGWVNALVIADVA